MVRKPTVFVLGAGASVEYGLPMGTHLIKDIVDGLTQTGFLRSALVEACYRENDIDEFRQKLVGSQLTSIDAFLEGNDENYQDIGKSSIAGAIL